MIPSTTDFSSFSVPTSVGTFSVPPTECLSLLACSSAYRNWFILPQHSGNLASPAQNLPGSISSGQHQVSLTGSVLLTLSLWFPGSWSLALNDTYSGREHWPFSLWLGSFLAGNHRKIMTFAHNDPVSNINSTSKLCNFGQMTNSTSSILPSV